MIVIGTALRIIWRSFIYRLKMREANNLAVTLSMMLAFRLAWPDLTYRLIYAVLLNMYVYLINDYFDIELDRRSPDRDRDHAEFMAAHRSATAGGIIGLGVLLLAGALVHSTLLVLAFVSSTAVIVLYSSSLKRVPIADLLMMAIAGGTGTIIGLPGDQLSGDQLLGWKLIGMLSILCCCYELIQIIRDEPTDRENKIKTTAVLLGVRTTTWIYRLVMTLAAVYGELVIGSHLALVLLVAALLPLSPARAARTWDGVRVISGSVWVGLMIQVYLKVL